jgi:hypothetical protein
MKSTGPALSAVFVDYDNIYLSLRRKSDEAAKRFAKDAGLWLSEIANGRLITPTNSLSPVAERRVVMSRCYGNPVPRRNSNDNSTDMNSFPFVRHHFLRSGFEAIDCPPLTAQLKNSADIRMVMDVRDCLNHDTYFDEFVILSGDADFTPLLHRLRAHARRTVIFANDHTAAPYTAIADGEIRESSLIAVLTEGRIASEAEPNNAALPQPLKPAGDAASWGREIIAAVVETVRTAGQPVPLEALADRAVRALGHERTVAAGWGGAGSFRDLLAKGLPQDVRLSSEPPYYVFDASRQIAASEPRSERIEVRDEPAAAVRAPAPVPAPAPIPAPAPAAAIMHQPAVEPPAHQHAAGLAPQPLAAAAPAPAAQRPPVGGSAAAGPAAAAPAVAAPREMAPPPALRQAGPSAPPPYEARPAFAAAPAPAPAPARIQPGDMPTAEQRSIARIFEACQAPPMSPPEYRVLFDCLAQEITANGLTGAQTLVNIAARAQEHGLELRRDDVRFVLEVVSEADPWFEQGASTALFASRFRNFVVARCRSQGLNLSLEELNLIEQWFSITAVAQRAPAYGRAPAPQGQPAAAAPPPQAAAPAPRPAAGPPAYAPLPAAQVAQQPAPAGAASERWWSLDEARGQQAEARQPGYDEPEEFPRIVKNRLRG